MKLPNFKSTRVQVCVTFIIGVVLWMLFLARNENINFSRFFKIWRRRCLKTADEMNAANRRSWRSNETALKAADRPKKKNPFVVEKNVTLGSGEIFKFNFYIAMAANNNAVVLKNDECYYTGNREADVKKSKFVLLSNFVYYQHKNFKSKLVTIDGKSPTDEIIDARIMEIVDVIQANLLHPNIQEVHILISEQEGIDFLKRIGFQNAKKLVLKFTRGESVTLKLQLLYASKCLKNRIIAISNQDNKFGTGWDELNPDILRRKKIMYALTRHSALSRCKGSTHSANCDPGYRYIGSHDTFVLDVRNGFTSEELKPIDKVSANLAGMENLFIWMFETKLGFTVLNPCPILIVNHHHCVLIRDKNRRRVNTGGANRGACFTDELE